MGVPRSAVRSRGTAFFIGLALATLASRAGAQAQNRSLIDQLAQQASASVQERYQRPLGRVAERRRDRVFTVLRQVPPPPGTLLEVVRAAKAKQPERVIARLEVLHTESGTTECREQERFGRSHAEPGDVIRRPVGTLRLLLAPCVALVDLAPEIPEVIGEKLRASISNSTVVNIIDDPQAERRAEAAYLSSAASEFVSRQTGADEVLFPVLLQTPGKMVLNLEYYSVVRGRATDIDVVSVTPDDLMRAWLRAGPSRQGAPPGFRRLPPLLYPWRVTALGRSPTGMLVATDSDSVRMLRYQFPGLRASGSLALGPRQRHRRDPWCMVVEASELKDSEGAGQLANGVVLLSDERAPQVLVWSRAAEAPPQLRPAAAGLELALERSWAALRPQARRRESRWWPTPDQAPSILLPCFADLDGDQRQDLVWTDLGGVLHVKLASQRAARSFPGFGDVKALQPQTSAASRPTLWLTDPVSHGDPDRLHAAQLAGDDLQLTWSSDPYDGTILALASLDLDLDGLADLVVAESMEEGTRLQAFLALGADRRARSGADAGGNR